MAESSVVKTCTCVSPYQDRLHGKGKRVFNWAAKAESGGAWRCTNCRKVQK